MPRPVIPHTCVLREIDGTKETLAAGNLLVQLMISTSPPLWLTKSGPMGIPLNILQEASLPEYRRRPYTKKSNKTQDSHQFF